MRTTEAAAAEVPCTGVDCPNKAGKLECPTCIKLGIKGSVFCSQECFKNSWKTHKQLHTVATSSANPSADGPWPFFKYTGSVRAVYPLSPRRPVPDSIPKPDYWKDGIPKSERTGDVQRNPRILNEAEIEIMRTSCRLGREVLEIAAAAIAPGVTTDELDRIVHEETIKRGAYPSPLNYRDFPKSVCTSVNEVICHGIPDQRKLQEGDIVNLDISLYYKGFHSDLNETYAVGKIDDESQKLIDTTRTCLDEAIAMCKPGALFRDIGKLIEPIAKANGCSVVRSYTAHGVNQNFHCAPTFPHYAKNKAWGAMKPGMTFTIEPMINLGTWHDTHWPDNWTAVTQDGKRSAQFEETLLITEHGCEVLTARKDRRRFYP
ncbi:methionine aminopeptidase [Dacryopinax primogenitus]|uniref:Methionine aminopeptidase n=1 Tax=Dacryopinax primogenitus (strain DJM 731) TaxID=1858805 RepID=M5FYR6_DACPD|nr:methionine aminopeptidase [Dacryopinax primogenitus]EJT96647.1 methionine aminopeptidase [Dacryopinax primogenitus]